MNAIDWKLRWMPSKRAFVATYTYNGTRKLKCVPVCIDDEEEAGLWFQDWLSRLQVTGGVAPSNDEVRLKKTVRSLIDRWEEWKKGVPGVDKKQVESDANAIRRYSFDHPFGDIDLEKELKVGRCVDWIEHLQKSGRAPLTVRNIVASMRTFVSDCRGKGWIEVPENPFRDSFVKARTKGAQKVAGDDVIVHLPFDDVLRLIESSSKGIPTIRKVGNCLAVTTGLREAEMQGLAWGDVYLDHDPPYVDVRRQLARVSTKEEPNFKPPKKKSYRQVPLHPLTVKVLRWWKEVGWTQWVGRAPEPVDAVLPNSHGQYVRHHGAGVFRQDLVSAGVQPTYEGHPQTFHGLRRSFLTMLTDAGVPDARVSALAGHGSKTVTAKHYVKKNIATFHAEVTKLHLPHTLPWLVLPPK